MEFYAIIIIIIIIISVIATSALLTSLYHFCDLILGGDHDRTR